MWAEIEECVQQMADDEGAPGASIALILDGQPWSAAVGWTSPERTARLEPSARFSIYSVTKIVLSSIVMMLAETDDVLLDDPIGEYLPDLSNIPEPSIRQLLTHTGAVPAYSAMPEYHEAVRLHPESPWTTDQFLKRTLSQGLVRGWRYSNVGYMLLRQMIEMVTEGLFRNAVHQFVALPLELTHFEVVESLADVASLTPGYSMMFSPAGQLANVTSRYHPGWVSHGLIASTAGDLALFLDSLVSGHLVGQESLSEMLDAIPVGETHPWMISPSYGLGLMIDPGHRFGVVAGHTGSGPGYSAAAYHFPNVGGRKVTVAALVNRDGADTATNVVFSIAEMML